MYRIILLDKDGYELAFSKEETLQDARLAARAFLREQDYPDAGAYRVEIRDAHDVRIAYERLA